MKKGDKKVKKFLSLIMCGAMLLTSTNAFAKMVGYHPADLESHTYYFEGFTEPVYVEDTEYLTVSNVRLAILDDTYDYWWKDLYAEGEVVLTVTHPINQLRISYYGENPGIDEIKTIIDETNVEIGKTYTFTNMGVYEINCNEESCAMFEIMPVGNMEFETIVGEQMVIDNPVHYVPVFDSNENVSATPMIPAVPGYVMAYPTDSEVVVSKNAWMFDAYNINDNNYFKLRDLAFAFTFEDESRPFDVTWDGEKNAINLISNKEYTPVGGECGGWDIEKNDWSDAYWDAIMNDTKEVRTAKEAIPTTSEIYIDGVKVNLTAYNIDGNNYFKLRDLAEAFDFEVNWDPVENLIYVSTYGSYIPE